MGAKLVRIKEIKLSASSIYSKITFNDVQRWTSAVALRSYKYYSYFIQSNLRLLNMLRYQTLGCNSPRCPN